jgi:Chaperone of endosialidase
MAYKFNPFTGTFDEVTAPGGSNTQVQFNDSGVFGGDVDFTYNKTSNLLTLGGALVVSAGTVTANGIQVGTGTTYKPGIYSPGTDQVAISTNGADRMRITEQGRVGIGNDTTTAAERLHVSSLTAFGTEYCCMSSVTATGSAYHHRFLNGNGVVGSIETNGFSTSFVTSSDYRLKKNVAAVTDSITRLKQLKPSRFNFIVDLDKTVDGFLAHEVQAIVPEAVTGAKDAVDNNDNPIYQGIDQSKLVPLLTAALQESIAKIESLETRLSALEGA